MCRRDQPSRRHFSLRAAALQKAFLALGFPDTPQPGPSNAWNSLTLPETPFTLSQQSLPAEERRSPWAWVPTLYCAEAVPYLMVMAVSVAMYKRLGVSNQAIAFYTSLLYLPWVIKPLWGPLVELYWTKRKWTVSLQALMAVGFAAMFFALQSQHYWIASLIIFTIIAFCSATHDIAADGYYMLALKENRQAYFAGIRSTFYRFATIMTQGILVMLVGVMEAYTGPKPIPLTVEITPPGIELPAERPGSGDTADDWLRFDPPVATVEPGRETTVTVVLTAPPDEGTTRAVAISAMSPWAAFLPIGPDQNIKFNGADRLEFGADNWQEPRAVVLSADKNVAQYCALQYKATSGNIALSWAIAFMGLAGLYILFSIYHRYAMAIVKADRGADSDQRPPFARAAAWLFLTVSVPVAVLILLFYGMNGIWSHFTPVGFFSNPLVAAAGEGSGVMGRLLGGLTTWHVLGLGYSAALFALLLLGVRWTASQAQWVLKAAPRGGAGSGFWCFVVLLLLFLGLHIGLNPGIEKVWKEVLNWRPLKPAAYTFFTHMATVTLAFLFFSSQFVRNYSLAAFRGAATRSGIPFDDIFISFFSKPMIVRMLAFLLLYRLGEAMLVKLLAPFLLDPRSAGGLGLSLQQYGLAYGTLGVLSLLIGGILGGVLASKYGLRMWIFWMCLAINAPDLLYVYLAAAQPESIYVVFGAVAAESFGYGFGFAAYMLYMLYIAGTGTTKTAHFALCTGFMAAGMMIPGMIAGDIYELCADPGTKALLAGAGLAESLSGYPLFFIIVCFLTIPGFITLWFIPLDPAFGRRGAEETGGDVPASDAALAPKDVPARKDE